MNYRVPVRRIFKSFYIAVFSFDPAAIILCRWVISESIRERTSTLSWSLDFSAHRVSLGAGLIYLHVFPSPSKSVRVNVCNGVFSC